MKAVQSIILALVLFVCQPAFASSLCSQIFVTEVTTSEKAQQIARQQLNEILRLEKKITKWLKWSGGKDRDTVLRDIRERELLQIYVRVGNTNAAINLYRNLFRTFEFSFFALKEGRASEADIVQFGELYGPYLGVRGLLERLAREGSTETNRKSAERVLKALGIDDLSRSFPELNIPIERPDYQEIKGLFERTPLAKIANLKKYLNDQRKVAIKVTAMNIAHLESVQKLVYSAIPARFRVSLTQFLGFGYNNYVLDKHLPNIEFILRMPRDHQNRRSMAMESFVPNNDVMLERPVDFTQDRLNQLREVSASTDQIEMLTTFARLTTGTNDWIEIKNRAKELAPTSPIYENFLAKLELAETKAAKLGDLSHYTNKPFSETIAAWAGLVAGSLSLADYFDLISMMGR